MVHALKEVWRVLRPAGRVVDVRPITVYWPVEVVSAGGTLAVGTVEDTLGLDDVQAADQALQAGITAGWFAAEQIAHFDYHWYWDTLAEITAYLAERWYAQLHAPEETLARAGQLLAEGGPGTQIRLSRRMVMARYGKCPPNAP